MFNFWKNTSSLILASVLLLAGCASKEVTVYTSAQQEYSEQQAQKIVERSFYEDIAKERVQAVLFFDEGIVLSHGTMTNTSGTAVAAPIGAGAIASGKSRSITTELGRRIYYTSIGNITIYGSVKNNNRYLAYVYHKDGRGLKKVYFIGKEPALRFVDAMYSLVKHYEQRAQNENPKENRQVRTLED